MCSINSIEMLSARRMMHECMDGWREVGVFFSFHVIACVCVFDCVHVRTMSVYMCMYMYVVSACMCVMYVCMRCVCQLGAL